jgi:hypothetical protein
MRYQAEKKDKGGDRGNQYVAKDQNELLPESTAERLAASGIRRRS